MTNNTNTVKTIDTSKWWPDAWNVNKPVSTKVAKKYDQTGIKLNPNYKPVTYGFPPITAENWKTATHNAFEAKYFADFHNLNGYTGSYYSALKAIRSLFEGGLR